MNPPLPTLPLLLPSPACGGPSRSINVPSPLATNVSYPENQHRRHPPPHLPNFPVNPNSELAHPSASPPRGVHQVVRRWSKKGLVGVVVIPSSRRAMRSAYGPTTGQKTETCRIVPLPAPVAAAVGAVDASSADEASLSSASAAGAAPTDNSAPSASASTASSLHHAAPVVPQGPVDLVPAIVAAGAQDDWTLRPAPSAQQQTAGRS